MDPKNQFDNTKVELIGNLDNSIKDLILDLDNDEVIDEETIDRMSESLTLFCFDAVNKFVVGQKKHGGKITDKNLKHELRLEYIDAFWYSEAENWKQELNENESRIEENEGKEESSSTDS